MMQPQRNMTFGWALCLGGATVGLIVLAGWLTGTKALATVIPGLPPMMPNSAIALFALGIAGALRRQKYATGAPLALSVVLAIVVLAIGVGTIAEYALHVRTPLDQLFMRSTAGPVPGRPSPPTAVAVTLLGAAILLLDWRLSARIRPSEWLILAAGLIALAALLGQLFGAEALYRLARTPVIGVSLPTALAVLMISSGLLLERSDAGVMRLLAAPGPGSVLLLRLALPAILVPAAFGLVAARFLELPGIAGIASDVALVFSFLTILTAVASLFLLSITAVRLNKTHDALERTRARMRALFEQASDGIFVADLDGRYVDVNDAGCRMLGYSRDEIIGKTIMDLIRPEDVERLQINKSRMLKGSVEVGEWLLRHKEGTNLPVEVSAKFLPDGRWQGFVRDISERKRAEKEQHLLAEVGSVLATIDFEEALTNIAQVAVRDLADICIIDLVESDGRMRRVRAACRDPANAFISDAIMGRENVEKPPPPIAMDAIRRPWLVTEVTPSVMRNWFSGENAVRAVQSTSPGSAMLVPLSAHGTHLGMLLLISSGSSRKFGSRDLRLAEAIAQRAALSIENALLYRKAMEATRQRDEMLGIVAHDLRNPLQIISTNAGILRRDASERTSEQAKDIGNAVKRMNRLIQDLLDVTRMEAGHLSLRPERLAVPEFITDLLDTQSALASSAGLELRAALPPDLPDAWADRDRLNQIFENLVGNAIKFSKPGGRITLGAQMEGNEIVFSVADTGAGIAEADFEHIFDRFWQAPKAKRRGAGLGLAIVKGLVQAHSGRIWVRSVVGNGSTFFFTVPIAALARGASGQDEAPKQAPARRATAV